MNLLWVLHSPRSKFYKYLYCKGCLLDYLCFTCYSCALPQAVEGAEFIFSPHTAALLLPCWAESLSRPTILHLDPSFPNPLLSIPTREDNCLWDMRSSQRNKLHMPGQLMLAKNVPSQLEIIPKTELSHFAAVSPQENGKVEESVSSNFELLI